MFVHYSLQPQLINRSKNHVYMVFVVKTYRSCTLVYNKNELIYETFIDIRTKFEQIRIVNEIVTYQSKYEMNIRLLFPPAETHISLGI